MRVLVYYFLIISLFLSSLSRAVEGNTIKVSEPSATKSPAWKIDIYGESYKSITKQIPILFSRWMIHRPSYLTQNGTLKVGFENFMSNLPPSANPQSQWSFSLGYYYSLHKALSVMSSVRAENINLDSSLHNYPLRVGLLGGTFDLIESYPAFFVESYYEAYMQSLRKSNSTYDVMKMGSASFKFGYRWEQSKTPFFIDPVILELRGYSASHPELAGDAYSVLNLGSRFIFYHESPSLYSSLFLTQSWRLDRANSSDKSPRSGPWLLFTFGGSF